MMATQIDIVVPEGISTADEQIAVGAWFFEDGEPVTEETIICQLVVAKASFDVPAPVAGILHQIAEVEAVVQPGDVIARIETA